MAERLDKLLAQHGLGSRKEVTRLIREGAVTVNGETARDGAAKVEEDRDAVTVRGEALVLWKTVVLMMNKPAGVLSASRDRHSPTVLDLLPPEYARRGLFPAGRLDRDTTGLLLITDDGDLAHRMLSPKKHVPKLYEAVLERPVTPEDVARFAAGLTEGGDRFAPARLAPGERDGAPLGLVVLTEGKYHQVKRMFAAAGNRVLALRRLRIGGLALDPALAPGQARLLSREEIESVFSASSQPELDP